VLVSVGGLNLFRYSIAGRYERGVASRALCVSTTRRLETAPETFLASWFAGLGPGLACRTGLVGRTFEGDGAGSPVGRVTDNRGRALLITVGLGDVGRDVEPVSPGRPAVLTALGRDVVIPVRAVVKASCGGEGGGLMCDLLGVVCVVRDVAVLCDSCLGRGNKKRRLR
jgi:hypothetical protein